MTAYYPIFINLKDKAVLVIGGGKVAERKVRSLLPCGPQVRVVSPKATSGLERLARDGRISYRARTFSVTDLKGARLVICATEDQAVNGRAAKEAAQRDIPCNVVDAPELGSFIVPSVIRRGDLTVAISTAGSSPALARKVRETIEGRVGPEYNEFLKLLKEARPFIQREVPRMTDRTQLYRQLVDSDALSLIQGGQKKEARETLGEILRLHSVSSPWRQKK
jgi:precorrin-2 dehydrogenase/sirohydrochlorin ferrochelatase